MRLKLVDPLRAELFGIQSDGLTEAGAIDELRARHPNWTDAQLKEHLRAAIDAGALIEESDTEVGDYGH